MRVALAILFSLAFALPARAEGDSAPPPGPPNAERTDQAFYERYAIIVERNIYSKNRPHVFRRPGAVAAQDVRREAPPPPLERSFVLTGIVSEREVHTAFVEDVRSGATSKVKAGDAVARGRVAEVGLDHLVYDADGRKARIELGQDLAGGVSMLPVRSATPSPPSPPSVSSAPSSASAEKLAAASSGSAETKPAEATPAEAKPGDAGAGVDDALERLRKKRLEEMKK